MAGLRSRFDYWRRIFSIYVLRSESALDFWHERPAESEFSRDEVGKYYMTFRDKAYYSGPRDEKGVIMLDYKGEIGRQYNPIAIAQYGLAHLNIFLDDGSEHSLLEARTQADWLVSNLKKNSEGVFVWKHLFPWRYVETMEPGWYSGLAQGCGISLLARIYLATSDKRYFDCAEEAFRALTKSISDGGVSFTDKSGDLWLEEYIVSPPSHILNGFIWTLWGVWDYSLLTSSEEVKDLFSSCLGTLERNLAKYDLGYWSRYDLSSHALPMIASPFYHRLHIVQLDIMYKLTGKNVFLEYRRRFSSYEKNQAKKALAFVVKVLFKLFYF